MAAWRRGDRLPATGAGGAARRGQFGLAAEERITRRLRPGDHRRAAVDAVGHEDPAEVGVAGHEVVVAAADHLDLHVVHVAVGLDVLDRRPHPAADGVFLDLDRQRRDQHQAAGVQVVAAADDQVSPFVLQRQGQLLRAIAIVLAVAQLDARLVQAGGCRPG